MKRKQFNDILKSIYTNIGIWYEERSDDVDVDPDGVVIYYLVGDNFTNADDQLHINQLDIQINYYHKSPVDLYRRQLHSKLHARCTTRNRKDVDSDYYLSVYRTSIIDGDGW